MIRNLSISALLWGLSACTAFEPETTGPAGSGEGSAVVEVAPGRSGQATAAGGRSGGDRAPGTAVGIAGANVGAGGRVAAGSGAELAGSGTDRDMGVAGMPGVGGSPAAGAGGRDASEESEMQDDLGKGDGSDVITIGDSWMLLAPGLGLEVSLERSAKNDYRNYAVPGTKIDEIIQQYADAKRADPEITTVVMTGGGNDILQDIGALFDCPMLGMTCRSIVAGVLVKTQKLWQEMAADGVHDIVIVMYSRPPMDDLGLDVALDHSAKVTEEACAKAPVRCTLVSASEVFGTRNLISFDNIHPTSEGYDLLGEATYEALVATGARR